MAERRARRPDLRDLGLRHLQLVSDTAKVTKGMSLYGLDIEEVLPLRPR